MHQFIVDYLLSQLPKPVAILAEAAIVFATVQLASVYLRLRHIPGPSLAALTNFVHRSWVLAGDRHPITLSYRDFVLIVYLWFVTLSSWTPQCSMVFWKRSGSRCLRGSVFNSRSRKSMKGALAPQRELKITTVYLSMVPRTSGSRSRGRTEFVSPV